MKVLYLEKTGTQKTADLNLWRYVKKKTCRDVMFAVGERFSTC